MGTQAGLKLWLPREFSAPEPAIGEEQELRRLLEQLPAPQAAGSSSDPASGAGSGSGSRVE